MRAIVQNAYGSTDVLELAEIEQPVVHDDDVLVRVRAAALNAGDAFSMRGSPFLVRFVVGFPRPRSHVPGWDLAGQVEAVGKDVTRFRPGDDVFGACEGTLAEYACAPEHALVTKPASLPFEKAAAVPTAGVTALRGLRNTGEVQPGHKVLINGASGGVGTFAVQIAKFFGAEVTGVCSTRNVGMVRSLGADHVVDYTQEDFTRGDRRYDLILDNVGSHSFSALRRVLTPEGVVQPNTGHAGTGYVIKAYVLSLLKRQHGRMFVATATTEDLVALKELISSRKVMPVVDKTYALEETPEAFRYLDEGHVRGKIVITV